MLTCDARDTWTQFLEYVKKRCSLTAFENWLAPIKVLDSSSEEICLEVPNIFVKAYLLDNYKRDLCSFLPVNAEGEPAIHFKIADQVERKTPVVSQTQSPTPVVEEIAMYELKLNPSYRFDNFIEGASNQFVKSAAMGIANRPGRSYNPLFIHGGVGLGKTHLLHAIGHYAKEHHKEVTYPVHHN